MRRYSYPISLILLLATWAISMQLTGSWHLMRDHWQMSATMVLGSFVAGSTPAGGGSVAFPIFTKALEIESSDAALFGLMIQSVGMSMAALFIVSRRIPYYRQAYLWAAAGGCCAVIPAILLLHVPAPFPKLLFSCLVFTFGILLFSLQWKKTFQIPSGTESNWSARQRLHLFITGAAGGTLSSQLGSGADMIVFVLMIVAFDLLPARAIPTTILTMATISVTGFSTKLIAQPEEIGGVWDYWAACVPIVAIGAPLGAFVLSKLPPRAVVSWVLALIVVEIVSTLLIIDFTWERVIFVAGTFAITATWVCFLMFIRNGARPIAQDRVYN